MGEHNEQQNEQQNNNLEQLSLPELEKKLEELKDVLTKLDPKANPDEYKKVEENIKIVEGLLEIKKEQHRKAVEEDNMSKKYFELLNSEKNIDDFSVDEAKIALEWLNINHNQFNDWDGVIEDIASIFKAETLGDIKTAEDVNNVQEKLINKIYGEGTFERGYSEDGKFIVGFNNETGNFVQNFEEFQSSIATHREIKEVNSKLLANYFKCLKSNGKLTANYLQENISITLLNDLQNLWKNEQDENKKIAYQTLKESNIDISQIITKTIKGIDLTDEINNLPEGEFLRNEYNIQAITDKNKFLKVLEAFKKESKNIELSNVPKIFLTDFLFNPNISLGPNYEKNISKLQKENLNTFERFDRLVKEKIGDVDMKNTNAIELLAIRMFSLGLPDETIKTILNKERTLENGKKEYIYLLSNDNRDFSLSIRLGRIGGGEYHKSLEKGNSPINTAKIEEKLKNGEKLEDADIIYLISKFLETKPNDKKSLELIVKYLNTEINIDVYLNEQLLMLCVDDNEYSKVIIEKYPDYIKYLPENQLKKSENLELFLDTIEDGPPTEMFQKSKDNLKYFDFLDINNALSIFEKFIIFNENYIDNLNNDKETTEKGQLFLKLFLQFPGVSILTSNLSNKINEISDEHKFAFDYFFSLVKENEAYVKFLLEEAVKFRKTSDDIADKINEEATKFGPKEKEPENKFNFNEKVLSKVLGDHSNDKRIKKFMENNPDPSNPKYADNLGLVLKQVIKNPEKIKNILAELHESRIKYLDVLKKKLEQDVSVSHVKNEKLLKIDGENKGPDGKPIKIFDGSATENEFSNLIERKKQELGRNLSSSEIENLKKEFIESNFEKLSPNEEEAIKKILAYIDGKRESTAILNNMDAYVDNYLENGAEGNFRDYLIEKGIDPDATPTLSNKDNTENFATETSSNNYDYDQKGGILDFEHNGQKTKVTLNEQEKSLARQNKETLKNIIDFYKTLDSVGLTDIWPYREQIFKGIQDVKPMGEFKSYNYDYLSENEIKIFLNAILKSTGREEIHSQLYPNLNGFIGKFKNLNGTNAFGNVEELGLSQSNAFSLGKSRIEQDFLNKFVNEGNFGFNQMKFRLTLNKE